MAELGRYTARVGLEPGSAPDTPVSGAFGQAIQGLGGAISNVEAAFRQRNEQREDFSAQNGLRKLQLELDSDLDERAQTMEPGGAGFHDTFLNDVYNPKRQAYLDSLPERLRPKFEAILGDGDEGYVKTSYSTKAAERERDEVYRWSTEQLDVTREQLANSISMDPEAYDDLLQQGYDDIDAAPLPTPVKEKQKRAWEQMAQVSHLNRMLELDPERVIKELGADPRYLSPTTQYDMLEKAVIQQESGGDPDAVSPVGAVGLMQVMPGTARDIAKELKDENFPFKGDPVQVDAYLKNAAINKRYGSFYLKKQLQAFGGDMAAALIAYNGGPERAKAWLKAGRDDSVIPKESRDYYRKIMGKLPGGEAPAKGAADNVKFVWSRDGGNDVLKPGDERLDRVNRDLRDRVATAYAALGIEDVRINSGFRDAKHNAAVGGAKKSQHIHGNAFDLNVTGMPLAKRVELIKSLSAAGITGIGVGANIIHADLGGRRAWGYAGSDGGGAVPKWAKAAIDEHMANSARAPNTAGRYASLPYQERQSFIRSADQVITKRYNDTVKANAVQKVEVRRGMDNELASLSATGQSTGFDDTQVATILGEDDYLKWIANKDKTQRMFTAKEGMNVMSPEELADRVQMYAARPGSPNFAAEKEIEDSVIKEADRVTKLRTTRPDKAALEFPEVKQAYEGVQKAMASGQADPDDVMDLVKMMLDRQSEFNVKPEDRAPIPREWALSIGQSLTRVPEIKGKNLEDVRSAIAVQYLSLQQFFGEHTEEVILYALSEYKGIGKNTADIIGSYMTAIEAGGDPLRLKPDRAQDMDQVEQSSGWWQSITNFFGGDEDEVDVPAPVEDTEPSPEILQRIIGQMDPEDGPAEEADLVSRYGQRAVDAAKAMRDGGGQ